MSEDKIENKLESMSELGLAITDAELAFETAKTKIENVESIVENLQESLIEAFRQAAKTFGSTIDADLLEDFIREFVKKPYFIVPMSEREWWLIVPSFITIEFGYLLTQDGPWNIFVVNQYSDMIQDIPQEFKDELKLAKPFGEMEIIGDSLILKDKKDKATEVRSAFPEYLGKVKDQKTILIEKGREFELMAALIRQGILPFKLNPIKKADILKESRFKAELRDYQKKDYGIFEKTGAVGIFYPMGGGKSLPALKACADLKGKKLILAPNASVASNWVQYFKEFTDIPEEQVTIDPYNEPEKEIHIVIYHHKNLEKIKNNEYVFGAYDEAPSVITRTRLEFVQIMIKYRMTLTATPFREDGNEDLIFALSVHPLGVDWKYFIENNLIKTPKITIWIEPDEDAKTQRLDELWIKYKETKTMVFCDSKALGRGIAHRYDVPFVSGDTRPKDRIPIIQENLWVVVSRVADMGISIKKMNTIIEYDFLFGSRHQETQRVGRLFHSEKEGHYHAITTIFEYNRYRGRFLELYRQGLNVERKRSKDIPFDLTSLTATKAVSKRKKIAQEPKRVKPKVTPGVITEATKEYPLFGEKRKLNRQLILEILRSDYAKSIRQGLSQKQIRSIIDFNNIKHSGQQLKNLIADMYKADDFEGRTVGNRRYYFLSSGDSE